jgi:antitoxin YefM
MARVCLGSVSWYFPMAPVACSYTEIRARCWPLSGGDVEPSGRTGSAGQVPGDEVELDPHLPDPLVVDQRDNSAAGLLYTYLYDTWRCPMKTMTYSYSRANYAQTLESVIDDREEVVITRAGHEPVVIVSLADYQSLKETAYLLQNPTNARRLLGSIERLESGDGAAHELAE